MFLPESFASQTTGTDSWQLGQVALVLSVWTIGGLVVALLTFRWQSRGR